ncbi:hypothetical protein BKA65DRAFT_169205 [Rhexocercosporidium sp. MPI-PUGE-AT-0058]|nr:hypothetical protein BKA65DRAFT_169205 [Rhexocercosporidium sp. MPI-PUGE-AT-0058]
MSTNGSAPGGPPHGLPNGSSNGTYNDLTNGYRLNGGNAYDRAPPTRPSSPELDPENETTPRVLLNARLAEAPSRNELLRSIPTSQPPFFSGTEAYTHVPGLPTRGRFLGQRPVNGGGANMNGGGPSTPAPATSRYLAVPGQEDQLTASLQGLEISSCGEEMLIPTPFNTPAPTPRASPTTPRRYNSRASGYEVSSESGIEVPPNTPITPPIPSPGASVSPVSNPTTPAAVPRYQPANFGSPLHPTRQNGAGPKKKQKGKLTNGKGKGKTKTKGKGSTKDKMLDDAALAVAHGESPIYTENITAILQHPEAVAVLSSAPDLEAVPIADLSSGDIKEAVAGFVNNGKSGFNDPDWLEEAAVASACREAGEYNEMMDAKFEEMWAEESGEEYEDEEGA